jgi:hypothetical protein
LSNTCNYYKKIKKITKNLINYNSYKISVKKYKIVVKLN